MAQQIDPQKLMEQLDQLPTLARVGVYALMGAVVVLIYYVGFHGGVEAKLTRARNELAKLEGEIAEARSVASNLESFRKRSEELQEELRGALERLPNAAQLPVLLTDISSLGKKSGLEFRAFKPRSEIEKDNFYAEVPIDIEFVGKYHEAGVFLDRLSRLSRIVNVTQLKMTVEDDREASPDLKVKGVATTFRFLDKPASASTKPGRGA